MKEAVKQFDTAVEQRLDHLRRLPFADTFFYKLSEAANHSVLWHCSIWLLVLLRRRPWRYGLGVSLALGVESALVNGVIKQLFRRQRPQASMPRPHPLRQPMTSSFPSGHATSAFFSTVLLNSGRNVGIWGLLAIAVALSRAYVRIHHASDVVAGAGLGLVMGKLARRISARHR